MKTSFALQLFAWVCLTPMAARADQPMILTVPVSASAQSNYFLSAQAFQAVNAYRRSIGAFVLPRHAGLDHLAQQHCEYLRQHRGTFVLDGKNVSHIGFDGRAIYARNVYHMDNIGENIAATNQVSGNPGPALVSLWKNSKSHQLTMAGAWACSGMGLVVDADGMVFAVQLFATMNNSLAPLHSNCF